MSKIDDIENDIHDTLVGIADLMREYVKGENVRRQAVLQLRRLEKLWGKLADAICKEGWRD